MRTSEEINKTINDICGVIQMLCKEDSLNSRETLPQLVQSAADLIKCSQQYID